MLTSLFCFTSPVILTGSYTEDERFFGSFQRKISGRNGTSENVVLFSLTECSKRKFVSHFFKAMFDTVSCLGVRFLDC